MAVVIIIGGSGGLKNAIDQANQAERVDRERTAGLRVFFRIVKWSCALGFGLCGAALYALRSTSSGLTFMLTRGAVVAFVIAALASAGCQTAPNDRGFYEAEQSGDVWADFRMERPDTRYPGPGLRGGGGG